MSDHEQRDQVECPKCGYWSPNVEVCDSCGALISKVRSRSLSEPETWSEEPERVISQEVVTGPREAGSSWPLMVVLIGAVGVGGFFAYKMGKLPFLLPAPPLAEVATAPVEKLAPAPGFQTIAAVAAESERKARMADPAATPDTPASAKLLGILANSFVTDSTGPKQDTAPTPAIMSKGGVVTEGPDAPAVTVKTGETPTVAANAAPPAVAPVPEATPVPPQGTQLAAAAPNKARFSTRANPIMIEIGEEQFKTGSYAPSTAPPKPRATAKSEEAADEASPADPETNPAQNGIPEKPADPDRSLVQLIDSTSFRKNVLHQSGGPVLVDFFATWCEPCKTLAPTVEAAAAHYSGRMKVVKLDIDESRDLTEKYDVKSFPTLLMFKNGREIDRAVGAISAPELQKLIEKNL